MIINDYDYFVNGILKSSSSAVKDAIKNKSNRYIAYDIPKNDGTRTINAIMAGSDLYNMQRNLCKYFLNDISLPAPAIGFVKDESYISYLSPHIGKNFFLRMDIKNFFDSINESIICKNFAEFFPNEDKTALEDFVQLCTLNNSLPQGAITSPAISNIVFRYVDQRILKYCQSFDAIYFDNKTSHEYITYTRYADDMLFSSNIINFEKSPFFIGKIISILKSNGYDINKRKTRCGTNQIALSGFVVGKDIHLSRRKLHELNKVLWFFNKSKSHTHKKYRVNKQILTSPDWLVEINKLNLKDSRGTDKNFENAEDFLNYLCGYRAFLISIIRGNINKNEQTVQLDKKIKKIEDIILTVHSHVGNI